MAGAYPAWPAPPARWTGPRIVSAVAGALLALVALALLAAGAVALWADTTQRQDGYLSISTGELHTAGHALASSAVDLGPGGQWAAAVLAGRVRVEAVPVGVAKPVFVGIGPADAVAAYLRGSHYATITGLSAGHLRYVVHTGRLTPVSPSQVGFWMARASGAGAQTVTWPARTGRWTAVVMNADGSAGVAVFVVAGVSAPGLTAVAAGLLAAGVAAMLGAAMLIVIPILRAARPQAAS